MVASASVVSEMDSALLLAAREYASLTDAMQQLAAAEDWEGWLQLEPERDAAFSRLAPLLKAGQPDEQSRAILKVALQQNRQMEAAVGQRRVELAELLKNLRKQQKVSRMYR